MSSPPFIFKKPLHSRTTDSSGVQRIVYTFPVDAMEFLCGTYDGEGSVSQALQTLLAEEREWLLRFVGAFLAATKSYFAKPYSSTVILRHLAHRVECADRTAPPTGPIAFTPTAIRIVQGQFGIEWSACQNSIDIQIPDEDSHTSDVGEDNEGIASASASAVAVAVPALPLNTVVMPPLAPSVVSVSAGATTAGATTAGATSAGESLSAVDTNTFPYTAATEVLSLCTPEQQAQERRRVREAHLRAKLAQYKAERTMTKYIQKYGDDLPYSSSESDWDTEGEGSGSESE